MKVSYPLMGDYAVPAKFLLENVLKCEVVDPPTITNKTIEIGNKYSPEFVCSPFKYTLGTMIESIEKGADTLIQLGGGCRYGYYGELQNKIIKDLSYDAKVINLVIEGKMNFFRIKKLFKNNGIKFSNFKGLYYGFITLKMVKYMDEIDDYIRENIGFEMEKGSLQSLKQEMLSSFLHVKSYRQLYKEYRFYREKIMMVRIHKPKNTLRIGIIGELYTVMEPFSNYYLERQLAENNIEVKRFTNAYYLLLMKKKWAFKYLKYAKEFIRYKMGADAADNIGRTKLLCEEGYDGIIHIKSSFCTPEIGAMPIINKIANKYDVPVLFFSFDANTSEVGIKTRLEAFYDMLEMRDKI